MDKLIGSEVFNKRNGAFGVVISQDETTITVQDREGVEKSLSHSTFKRWWQVTPSAEPFTPEENAAVDAERTQGKAAQVNATDKKGNPMGEKGVGVQLRDKFVSLVKELGVDGVEIFHNDKNHSDIIKFNGKNVFECAFASRRFSVLCHPESLTPDNKKRAIKIFPKEWGWSLRAKFVFTELTQWPLMKSIISDGLFYRKS